MLVKCLLMLLSSPDTPPPPGGVWVEKCIICFNYFYSCRTYGVALENWKYIVITNIFKSEIHSDR